MSVKRQESRLVYSTGGERPTPAPEPAADSSQRATGVRIRLDRRASGRVVTVVTGLPPGADLVSLVRALKAACGAGGTLKDGVLELQGDHRERIESALTARKVPWKRAGG